MAGTEYGFDRNSNRVWRDSPGSNQDEYYTYDGVNRLESRDQGTLNAGKTAISGTPVEEEVFDLDATANIENYLLKENGSTQLNQSRTYAANNENVLIAGSGSNVAYDANGNMTTLPVVGDFSSNWTAVYDAWNRLVEVKSGGSPLEEYAYDGLNRRVQKDDGSVRDFYYSDEWQIVEERIADATPADKSYVWGLRYIDDLVWIDDGVSREYALHDYYSIIAVTNASGVVQQRYGFSAYGERKVLNASYVQTSSSATSDVGYGGYYEDSGTKMYQVRNRFLHPGLGRWINRDPIGYGGGINLYGYVNGNPVNGVDYYGLEEGISIDFPMIPNDLEPSEENGRAGLWWLSVFASACAEKCKPVKPSAALGAAGAANRLIGVGAEAADAAAGLNIIGRICEPCNKCKECLSGWDPFSQYCDRVCAECENEKLRFQSGIGKL